MAGSKSPPQASALAVVAGMLLAGCSHLSGHWPWAHRSAPPPEPVHELVITRSGAAADYPQYWKRNTLVVDLRSISGEGGMILTPRTGGTWPVRLAFRVNPGAVAVLEVRGEERVVIPVSAGNGPPLDLELVPGVYSPTTVRLTVRWGAP